MLRVADIESVQLTYIVNFSALENKKALLEQFFFINLLSCAVFCEHIDTHEQVVQLIDHPELITEVLPQIVYHHIAFLAGEVEMLWSVKLVLSYQIASYEEFLTFVDAISSRTYALIVVDYLLVVGNNWLKVWLCKGSTCAADDGGAFDPNLTIALEYHI